MVTDLASSRHVYVGSVTERQLPTFRDKRNVANAHSQSRKTHEVERSLMNKNKDDR